MTEILVQKIMQEWVHKKYEIKHEPNVMNAFNVC